MKLHPLWQWLHLVFAISWIGTLVLAEWNGRAARATSDWSERALLFQIVHLATRVAGAGSLFLAGVLGHASAFTMGYHSGDPWLMWVAGLWVAALAGMLLLNVPLSRQLATLSRLGAAGGATDGYASALARWRFANVLQSVLYLALLALMVLRWRS